MTQHSQIVGVIGAGQMGCGIAQVTAQANLQVLMADMSLEVAQKGKQKIADALAKQVQKNKLREQDREAVLEKLRPVGGFADLAAASFVVEAASENENLKRKIFLELESAVPNTTILATNTSSISITWLAGSLKQPQRVIGMHFMNPVPVMQLVEVIRGVATSEEAYGATVEFAKALGKTVVTSSDYPGFIVNRILMPMINEAAFALMEGVASAKDIDAAMTLGTNQPMGPLTLADFIGLDTCVAILEVMHTKLGDSKYRPCPLMRRLVDAGHFGKKAGRGFYTYEK